MNTYIRVQHSKQQLTHNAHGIGARIQLIQEALVPRIHTVLQYLGHNLQQTLLSRALFAELELLVQQGFQLLGGMMLDECRARPTTALGEVFGGSSLVSSGNEGNDQVLDGIKELTQT